MLRLVVSLAIVSVSFGFTMMPKSSQRFFGLKMAGEDPWFPGSLETNFVDLNALR